MPRIPIRESQQVQIQQAGGAQLSQLATPQAFGVGQARDIGVAADAIQQTANVLEGNLARSNVRHNLNNFRDESREYMTSVYERKGKEANNAYNDVESFFDKKRKEYSAKLNPGAEQDLFNQAFDSISNSHKDRGATFQAQKRAEYEIATLDAENATAVQDSIAARNDPAEIDNNWKTIEANTRYKLRGQDKAIIKSSLVDAENSYHTSILNAKVSDSPLSGLNYFKDNKDKFKPSVRAGLQESLEAKAVNEKAYGNALIIANSGKSLGDQLKEVDKIKNVDEAKTTRAQVKMRFTEQEAISKAEQLAKIESEMDKLYADPLSYEVPESMPYQLQGKMIDYKKKAYEESIAQSGGKPAKATNWVKRAEILALPKAKFDELDLTKHLVDLATPEYKELDRLQRESRKGNDRVRTVNAQANQSINSLSQFYISRKDKEEARKVKTERKGQFFEQFEKELSRLSEDDRTEENVKKIIDTLLFPVTMDRSFLPFTEKQAFRFEIPYVDIEKDKEAYYKQNIPEPLKQFPNAVYQPGKDNTQDSYIVDGDGIRRVYDINGRYVTSFKAPIGGSE